MDIQNFKQHPVLGILRGITEPMIESIVDASVAAGLQSVEITMNTKDAPLLIKKMINYAKGKLTIGAGTVLSMSELDAALNAGASFIVMPVLIEDVTDFCAKNNIPNFPGALSPTEIYKAWNAGATMVKVFPANVFGINYFKEIKGPFNDIKLLATGGVSAENAQLFLKSGADAVSFGASIFKKEWLETNRFDLIQSEIKKLVDAVNNN